MTLRILYIVCLICLFLADSKGQTNQEKVDSVIGSYFKVLDGYLKDRNSDPPLRRTEAIGFFERITKIESDADGTFIGKLSCTETNVRDWKVWVENHRDDLVWNAFSNRVEKRLERDD